MPVALEFVWMSMISSRVAAKLQKRVSERAEEFVTSGDPADVIAKAALTKCGDQRVSYSRTVQAFLDIRDGRCGLEMQPPKTIDEIDRQIEESQPYIEMFERDLLEVATLAVVE